MGFCTSCGSVLQPGVKFCTSCGTPAQQTTQPQQRNECKKCHKSLSLPLPKFCIFCGEATASTASTSSTASTAASATPKRAQQGSNAPAFAQVSLRPAANPVSTVHSTANSNSSGSPSWGARSIADRAAPAPVVVSSTFGKSETSSKPVVQRSQQKKAPPVRAKAPVDTASSTTTAARGSPALPAFQLRKSVVPASSSSAVVASTSVASTGDSKPEWAKLAEAKTNRAAAKTCPGCGTHNSGSRFCISCGEQLQQSSVDLVPRQSRVVGADGKYAMAQECSNCGKRMGSRFCTGCGSAAGQSKPAPSSKTIPDAPPTQFSQPLRRESVVLRENAELKAQLDVMKAAAREKQQEQSYRQLQRPAPAPVPDRPTRATYPQSLPADTCTKPELPSLPKPPVASERLQEKQPASKEPKEPKEPKGKRFSTLRSWKAKHQQSLKEPLDMKALKAQYNSEGSAQSDTTGEASSPSDAVGDETGDSPNSGSAPKGRRRTWKKRYDTMQLEKEEFAKAKAAYGLPNEAPAVTRTAPSRSFMDPNLTPRERAVREIIDTEEDYCKDLSILVDVLLVPCREQKGVKMTSEDVQSIFSNIEMIRGVNDTLLEKLRTCDPSTGNGIGDAFISMAPYLRMYANFCANQSNMFATMERLKADTKRSNFESFLSYCIARPECRNLDFNSFMIKPMQRITKYPLLLRELIKHTDETHAEYDSLRRADEVINDIVIDVNEKKKNHESSQKLIELRSQLYGGGAEHLELITPTRRLEREQELVHYASNGKLKPGYFFLFNDLIVYSKKSKKGHMLKAWVPLAGASVNAAPSYKEPTFELHSPATCYKPWPLACKSPAERALLMDQIQEFIDQTTDAAHGHREREILSEVTASVANGNAFVGGAEIVRSNAALDLVTFRCSYEDERVVQIPRSDAIDIEIMSQAVCGTFGLPGCTLYFGDTYLDTIGLAALLSNGATTYDILVYDAYED